MKATLHSKKRFSSFTCAIFGAVVFVALLVGGWKAVFAAAPNQGIGFQGQLYSSGSPVSASVSASFAFYDALSGGSQQGSTIPKTVTVTNGYFSTTFTEAELSGIDLNQSLWLEVTVNGNTLTPRSSVNAVPFASKAFGAFSFAVAPTVGPSGSLYYDSVGGVLKVSNGSSWMSVATASASTTSINGAMGPTFTFATSSSGTDFSIATSTGTVTFNIPSASATNRGLLTAADYLRIPSSASSTEWASFFATPSGRITAGNGLSWSGNTLNAATSSVVVGAGYVATATTTDAFRAAYFVATSSTAISTFAGGLRLNGAFFDASNASGTSGMVLQSTGTGTSWIATSSLGFGSGSVNSGTLGQVAFYGANGTTVSGTSTLFLTGEKVGIGTSTPAVALDVWGNFSSRSSGLTYAIIGSQTDANAALTIGGSATTTVLQARNSTDTSFKSLLLQTGSAQNTLFIGTNGNVGIGTTTPLAVAPNTWNGSANSRALQIDSQDTVSDSGIMLRRVDGATGLDLWSDNSVGDTYIDSRFGGSATRGIMFRTNTASTPVNAMFIASSNGFVGIGTTTPVQTLSVAGSLRLTGAFFDGTAASGTAGMVLQTTGTGTQWVATSTLGLGGVGGSGTVNSGLLGQVAFYSANGTAVSGTSTLFINGNSVGIGTTTPATALGVYSTASSIAANFRGSGGQSVGIGSLGGAGIIQGYSSDSLVATVPLNLQPVSGNVGIGTATPATRFQVTGTAGTNPFRIASSTFNSMFEINQSGAMLLSNSAGTAGMVLQSNGTTGAAAWVATSTLGFPTGGSGTVNSGLLGQVAFYGANGTAVSGTSTLFLTGNSVGIGTTTLTTGAKLNVKWQEFADQSVVTGIKVDPNYSAADSNGLTLTGIDSSPRLSSTLSGGNAYAMYGVSASPIYSGATSNGGEEPRVYGMYSHPQFTGSISANDAAGMWGLYSDVSSNLGTTAYTYKYGVYSSVTGTADVNYGLYVTAASGDTNYGVYSDGGTNYFGGFVGVGTSTPGYYLTVAGDIGATGALRFNGNAGTAGYVLQSNGSAAPSWVATSTLGLGGAGGSGTVNSGLLGQVAFYSADGTAVSGTSTLIITGEKVGIGTTTPSFRLDVSGDINVSSGSAYRYNGLNILTASTTKDNYFFGNAGNLTMTGADNLGVGLNVLSSNTTGSTNVGVGGGALNANTSGVSNTVVGVSSAVIANASYNTIVGQNSLVLNSAGGGNATLGYGNFLFSETSSSTAVGYRAGASSFGQTNSSNSFFGYQAGVSITSGSNNLFLGHNVGTTTTSGSNNILIGTVLARSASDSNYLNIGNAIFGDLSTGKVGIGTTSPLQSLSVQGGLQLTGAFFDTLNASGTQGMVLLSTGTGTNWVATSTLGLGGAGGSGTVNSGLLGQVAFYSADGTAVSGTSTLFILGEKVGIGSSSPSSRLTVSGDIDISSGSAYKYGGLNIAYGSSSLGSFFGGAAGSIASMGQSNTGFGYQVLALNAGNYNTALGQGAMTFNSAGNSNTAIGQGAMGFQSSGDSNVAIGLGSLSLGGFSTPQSNNTVVGYQAGQGAFGQSFNNATLFGYQAGKAITTGNNNLMLGYNVGTTTTTGSGNILIGTVLARSSGDSNFLNIGDAVYGDLTTGNVGIGTTTPVSKLGIVSTTEQLRVGYDSANYLSATVQSDGTARLNLSGTNAGWVFAAPSSPAPAAFGAAATTSFAVIGATGGATNSVGASAFGGAGGAIQITAGMGADATTAAVSNFAGQGGGLVLRSGNGGNASGPAVLNFAGLGGNAKLVAGSGGDATGANSSGGQGGSLYLGGGTGGTGTLANGAPGAVYLGADGLNRTDVIFGSGVMTSVVKASTGFFGIGTSTPGYSLTVSGDISLNATGTLRFAGNAGTAGMVLQSNGTSSAPVWVATSSLGFSAGGSGTVNSGLLGQVAFYSADGTAVSGTSTLFISGNSVGIGTSSAANTLFVQGRGGIDPFVIASSTGTQMLAFTQGGNLTIGTAAPIADARLTAKAADSGSSKYIFSFESSLGTNLLYLRNDGVLLSQNSVFVGGGSGIESISSGAAINFATGGGLSGNITISTLSGTGKNILLMPAAGGNVGIGTSSPVARFAVDGDAYFTGSNTFSSTTATTTISGGLMVGGGAFRHDWSSGITTIDSVELGALNFAVDGGILSWADMDVTASTSSGTVESYGARIDGNSILTVYAESDGSGGIQNARIGIGTTTPGAVLDIWGNLNVATGSLSTLFVNTATKRVGIGQNAPVVALHIGSTTIADATNLLRLQDADSTCDFNANNGSPSCGSDVTLKKNIESMGGNLDKILSLRPVTYNWKTDADGVVAKVGFIAQEVGLVMPELVQDGTWIDGTTRKFLSTGGMIPYLVGAVKEQQLLIGDAASSTAPASEITLFVDAARNEAPRTALSYVLDKINAGARPLLDFMSVRVTAIRGYFDELFSRKVHTEQLCVKKSDGSELCVTGDQLQTIMSESGAGAGGGSGAGSGSGSGSGDTGGDTSNGSSTDSGGGSGTGDGIGAGDGTGDSGSAPSGDGSGDTGSSVTDDGSAPSGDSGGGDAGGGASAGGSGEAAGV
jgi:hypothetical protein